MFNLLRMDLYRMKISKSFYVCLGVLISVCIFAFGVLYMVANPEMLAAVKKIGVVITTADVADVMAEFKTINILEIFAQINIQGGLFVVISGVYAVLMVCGDFSSGFMKNIASIHEKKWKYIVSKMITLGIQNLIYLIVSYIVILILNLATANFFNGANLGDVLLHLVVAWLLLTAFSSLMMLICTVARSEGVGITAAICLGSGLLVQLFSGIFNIFGIGEILNYTIYTSLINCPISIGAPETARCIVTGVVYLLLYTVLGILVMDKKDI